MSSIDERIVRMEFDNARFQKGIQSSLAALESLETGLNVDKISAGVENISSKYNAFGAIAATGLVRVTNAAIDAGTKMGRALVDPIVQGGKKRALNIEQAKFQFEGLGLSVEKMMDSSLKAVKGTAFGLDEAAVVAAQFGASGVKAGKEMTSALTGISGVAAMAGASYTDIGNIFTKIAGQGRVMGDDLNRLGVRGINAAAEMAKAMGTTEEEVRSMVTKGKISFKEFAKVMDEAFGEHATKASETYTGALSNVNAALARIGAVSATLKHENLRRFFVAVTPVIDNFQEVLQPIQEILGEIESAKIDRVVAFLEKLDFEYMIKAGKNVADTIKYLNNAVNSYLTPIKNAFISVFGKGDGGPFGKSIMVLTERIMNFSKKLHLPFIAGKRLEAVFEGVFKVAKIAGMGLSIVGKTILFIGGLLLQLGRIVLAALSPMVEAIKGVVNIFKSSSGDTESFLNKVIEIAKAFDKDFDAAIEKATEKVKEFVDLKVVPFFENWRENVQKASEATKEFVDDRIVPFLQDVKRNISETIDKVKEFIDLKVVPFFKRFRKGGEGVGEEAFTASMLWGKVTETFKNVVTWLGNLWKAALPVLSNIGQKMGEVYSKVWQAIKSMDLTQVLAILNTGVLITMFTMFRKFLKLGGKFVDGFVGGVNSIKDAIVNFQKESKPNQLIKIAIALGVLAIAIWALGKLDLKDVGTGLAAMGGSLAILLGGLLAINKFMTPKDVVVMGQITTTLIKLSIAIAILAFAMEKMQGLRWQDVVKGLIMIGVTLAALVIAVKSLKDTEIAKAFSLGLALIALSVAILIISKAVEKMGAMRWQDLAKGLAAMAVVVGAIVIMAKTVKPAEILAASVAMLAMAIALTILSGAILIFGKMDYAVLEQGLTAVGLALLGITLSLAILGQMGERLFAAAAALLALAISLSIISGVIILLGQIEYATLEQGLTAVIILIASLTLSLAIIGELGPQAIAAAAALLAMGVALLMIAQVILVLGSIDMGTLIQGILGVSIVMAVLVLAVNAMNGAMAGAASMVFVAASLLILAIAIRILASAPADSLNMALKVLIGAMLGFVVVVYLLAPAIPIMLALAAVLLAVGIAAILVAGAFMIFALGVGLLGVGLATAAGGIMVFAMAMGQVSQYAGDIAIMGAALLVFGVGALIAGVGVGILAIALVVLAVGLMLIAAVGPIATLVIIDMITQLAGLWTQAVKIGAVTLMFAALGAALIVLGVGALATGAGLLLMGAGLIVLGVASMLAEPAVNRVIDALTKAAVIIPIATLLGSALGKLGQGAMSSSIGVSSLASGLMSLASSSSAASAAVMMMSVVMIGGFNQAGAASTAFAVKVMLSSAVISAGMKTLSSSVSSNVKVITLQFVRLGSAAGSNMKILAISVTSSSAAVILAMSLLGTNVKLKATLIVLGFTVMTTLVTIQMTKFVVMLTAQSKKTVTVMESMAKGIQVAGVRSSTAASNAVKTVLSRTSSALSAGRSAIYNSAYSVGVAITQGMANGLYSNSGAVGAAARTVALRALASAKATLDVRSPSRKFYEIFYYGALGMANGLMGGTRDVEKASEDVALSAIDMVRSVLEDLSEMIEDDIDLDPVITPVFNLDEFDKGKKKLSSSIDGIDPGTTTSMARSVDRSYEASKPDIDSELSDVGSTNVTFIQKNSSPKALDTAEIYRQTKNQLSIVKKGLPVS